MTDFRAKYWIEADGNIREAHKYEHGQLGYWANMVCALVNAAMAALPDSLTEEVLAEQAARQSAREETQRRVRRSTKRQLKTNK